MRFQISGVISAVEMSFSSVRVTNGRLDHPWPSLAAFCDSFDFDKMEDVEHSHVPYGNLIRPRNLHVPFFSGHFAESSREMARDVVGEDSDDERREKSLPIGYSKSQTDREESRHRSPAFIASPSTHWRTIPVHRKRTSPKLRDQPISFGHPILSVRQQCTIHLSHLVHGDSSKCERDLRRCVHGCSSGCVKFLDHCSRFEEISR